MSATNYTTNLGLSQFVNTDVPAWRQDYNGDMLKIDNAYTADISGATAETSADPSDYMKFYDVSATTNKKILISDLLKGAKVEDLTDTDITTPVDDDGLVYDATAQKWENVPIMTKEQWKKNGAYNLCPIDGVTEVKQAVTFTVNSNRTISANGTSTGEIYYTVASATFTVDKTGSYKFVGRPSDITGTCNLFVYVAADGGAVLTDSDGTGAIGTLTAGVVYGVSIYVASGVNISNKTFKPLLTTDLNATYDDYVPYAKTNRELTEVNNTYASYGLYEYSANGCTVYATGVRIGNFAVLQGKWFKSTGLTNPSSFISSLPSALLPYEDTTGSGIYIIKSSGAIETGLPKVTTSGNVLESATSAELTEGSFSIVYRAK